MTTEWLGGGFMIALAAILWLAYLIPSWSRSRQYLATERNAVRLQQTLRILAETSEVPEEVRIEASARSIAEQERILKHRAVEREAAAIPAAVRTADRLRRSRAITAGVLALSVAVAVLGGMQAVYTGAWIILVAGVIASVVSITVLVKLARASRGLRLPRPVVALVAQEFVDHAEGDVSDVDDAADVAVEESTVPDSGWVPVSVPRPLYLGRASAAPLGLEDATFEPDEFETGVAAIAMVESPVPAAVDDQHRESLLRAAAEAEDALRSRLAAEHETVAELPVAREVEPVAPPAPSRFARMGIVDDDTASHLDLDAVLARRRAG
ncbi:hypothetical protein N1027_09570 [Herbiconiux sp. CPCC 205763]|uniref:Large exoprotein n=1 Tax=Herbiconiux aconitum TaxID=2970913 RepID=A0ABT2GQH7_9MICO|nr:hypothetical protein [Herbiconiux aconitum]MCS5718386.1 hypothetical protein [Herbiconiux aconitum]